MTRLAALYDIHSNLPALEAVLREIRQAGVDQIVVGGDVLPGPMPRESLACLLDLDIPVQFIQGNGDRVGKLGTLTRPCVTRAVVKNLKKLGLWPNEEGGPMKKLVFVTALLAAVALAATPAHAQAAKGENIIVLKDSVTTKLPGGKSYMTVGTREVCTSSDAKNPFNGASGDCDGACLIDAAGKATCMGSCTWVDHDGEVAFITWDGQTAGSWKVAGGTGKWKTASGGGTWKNTDSAAGNFTRNAWEGTFSMKK